MWRVGDTSCADHNVAWRVRATLGLDKTPQKDAIIYDLNHDLSGLRADYAAELAKLKLFQSLKGHVGQNGGLDSIRCFNSVRAWSAVRARTRTCRMRPSASRIRVSAIARPSLRRTVMVPQVPIPVRGRPDITGLRASAAGPRFPSVPATPRSR